jgi:hypothetical protein
MALIPDIPFSTFSKVIVKKADTYEYKKTTFSHFFTKYRMKATKRQVIN